MTTRSATDSGGPPSKKIKMEDNRSDDTEFTLISSDGIRFGVHTYHLKSASSVLRDMLSVGPNDADPELTLTDIQIERSAIIDLFLQLIEVMSMVPRGLKSIDDCQEMMDLIRFCQKYECKSILHGLTTCIRLWVTERVASPLSTFVLGCQLRDINICVAAIKSNKRSVWVDPLDHIAEAEHQGISNRQVMDLASAPLWYIQNIPPTYLCALLRATAAYPLSVDTREQRNARSVEFVSLMKVFDPST